MLFFLGYAKKTHSKTHTKESTRLYEDIPHYNLIICIHQQCIDYWFLSNYKDNKILNAHVTTRKQRYCKR